MYRKCVETHDKQRCFRDCAIPQLISRTNLILESLIQSIHEFSLRETSLNAISLTRIFTHYTRILHRLQASFAQLNFPQCTDKWITFCIQSRCVSCAYTSIFMLIHNMCHIHLRENMVGKIFPSCVQNLFLILRVIQDVLRKSDVTCNKV